MDTLGKREMAKVEEIVEAPEVPPPKINNASLSELKATSDDAIAPVSYTSIIHLLIILVHEIP